MILSLGLCLFGLTCMTYPILSHHCEQLERNTLVFHTWFNRLPWEVVREEPAQTRDNG